MAKNPSLAVNKRTVTGRSVKKLRRENIIPGNIYGKKIKSQTIQIKSSDFLKTYQQVGETGLLELKVDSETKTRPVLISDVHKNPVTDSILHVDFHQVDLTVKVTTSIPLEFIAESLAVKDFGGVLNKAFLEIEVEALPADLPDNIEVDISSLKEIGDSFYIKDLKVSNKVNLLLGLETLIVSVQEQKEEEVEPEPAEVEVEADADVSEGEEVKETEKESAEDPKDSAQSKETKPEEKSTKKSKEEK